jgi:hypothetical protein
MQTNALCVASGIHKFTQSTKRSNLRTYEKGTQMSKTVSIGFAPSSTLLARLMASVDRLLTASARISNRNGDLPRFGL